MNDPVRIHPRLRHVWAFLLLAIAIVVPSYAQQARHVLITKSERKFKDVSGHLMSTARAVPLTVDMRTFRSVAGAGELRLASVPLAPNLAVDLDLVEYSIFEPGAIRTITSDRGVEPMPPTTARLYRGRVAGNDASWAYLSFSDNSVLGTVTIGEETYQISTDLDAQATPNAVQAKAYPLADVYANDAHCAINEHNILSLGATMPQAAEIERLMTEQPPTSSSVLPGEIQYAVKGAFDADYEYLNNTFAGDRQKAEDYMVQIIGQMSAVYERDLSCQISISYMNIWDTRDQSKGYSYLETGSMETALFQANTFWVGSHPTVERGFAHVFSGKPWVNPIGIAFLDVLCNKLTATCYSLITRNNPEQDMKVISHETGHVFGSPHTHSCRWNPEVDRCAAAEDGNCFGPSSIQQTLGTIMSYCSQSELKFHEKGITYLKNLLLQRACVELSRRLTVNPLGIYFPNAQVNIPIDTVLEACFQNNSRQDLEVTEMTLAGTNADAFTISEPAAPFTLRPGEYKTLRIRFLSDSEDPALATLTIKHNGLNRSVVINLEAYARAKQPVLGIIAGGKAEIDFGTRRVGATVDSAMKTLFANIGTALLRAHRSEIIGPDRFEFQIVEGTPPFEIESGDARRGAKFRFSPTTPGDKLAYFVVESNSRGGSKDTLTLKGFAKVGPRLTLKVSQLSVNFHNRESKVLHDTTFTQFFYNSGSDTLQIIGDLEGENASSFNVNVAAIDLAPGESYDLPITLYDSVPGYKKAYMVINQIETEDFSIYRRDTVWLLANITGPSAAPGASPEIAGFSVTPNPTSAEAQAFIAPMPGEAGREYTVTVTDAAGRVVHSFGNRFKQNGETVALPTGNLAAGVYYLRLSGPKGSRIQTLTVVR